MMLQCARHCSKFFIHINYINPHYTCAIDVGICAQDYMNAKQ